MKREEAIKCLEDVEVLGFDDTVDNIKEALKMAIEELKAQRMGYWIDTTRIKGFPESTCSLCGSIQGIYWMNYCPNCGARMEWEKDD